MHEASIVVVVAVVVWEGAIAKKVLFQVQKARAVNRDVGVGRKEQVETGRKERRDVVAASLWHRCYVIMPLALASHAARRVARYQCT